MAGLLDILGGSYGTDDPRESAYMALAAGLLGGKGSFGSVLGQSMVGAQNTFEESRKNQQAAQLNRTQIEEINRKAALAKRQQAAEDAFRASLVSPQMQASQAALAGGGGPTVANAANMPQRADPNQQLLFEAMRSGLMSPLDYIRSTQKDTGPIKLGAGEKLLAPGTFRELASNPKADADSVSPAMRMLTERDKFEPGSAQWRVLNDALMKATTHAPGVQVSYGAPVAGVNDKGESVFFRPPKNGGAPEIMTGVKPAPQNRDVKLPAEMQRMNVAADSMVALLDDYEGWLKKNNPRDPATQMSSAKRADMQSLMKNLQLQYKELAALGALTGPDLQLMEQALSDPFTLRGAYYGADGLLSQIKQARKLVDVRRKAIATSQGKPDGAAPPAAADTDPLGLRK